MNREQTKWKMIKVGWIHKGEDMEGKIGFLRRYQTQLIKPEKILDSNEFI